MNARKYFFLFFLVMVLLLPLNTFAETDAFVKIADIKGTAEIKRLCGKPIAATAGIVLNEGDAIRTRRNSEVVLELYANGK